MFKYQIKENKFFSIKPDLDLTELLCHTLDNLYFDLSLSVKRQSFSRFEVLEYDDRLQVHQTLKNLLDFETLLAWIASATRTLCTLSCFERKLVVLRLFQRWLESSKTFENLHKLLRGVPDDNIRVLAFEFHSQTLLFLRGWAQLVVLGCIFVSDSRSHTSDWTLADGPWADM